MKKNMVRENGENVEKSFLEKYKTDKKYKAKVEMIGYGVFLVVIILYLNIASMTSSPSSIGNVVTDNDFDEGTEENSISLEKVDWLESIDDNYEYQIQVSVKVLENETSTDKNLQYSGKRYESKTVIDKQLGEIKNTYYKIDSMYYQNTLDGDSLVEVEDVYDLIDKSYIEWDNVREYLDMANLDHVTDYSTGKKEYVYHLKVREVIKTYTKEDEIEFSIVSENETLSIEVDYSNLIKVMDEEVIECKIKYIYQNIGKVEDFQTVIEND